MSLSLELLLSLPGVPGLSGFGVPFCLGSERFSGVVQASFPVGAGVVVPASFLVGTGGIIPASFLVGTCGIIPAAYSVGELIPFSDPSSGRSIKSFPTLLSTFFFSFASVDGEASGSIVLLSGNRSGTDIPWSAGHIPWFAGHIPWLTSGTEVEVVRSRLALLRSSMPGS